MFCVRCGRRDLAHGKRCMYCKTRLVYPADLRFLNERDARLRERRSNDEGRGLFDPPSEKAKERKYSEWPETSSKRSFSDRPRGDAETGRASERLREDTSSTEELSSRPRDGARTGASSEKSRSDRPREDAETGGASNRLREDTSSTEGLSSRPRDDAKTGASSEKSASSRKMENSSGRNPSDRKRENAKTDRAGTAGRWSLFDRAREETKSAARPGFVEKAEASARARAEKEAAQSGRSRVEKAGQSGRRGVAEKDGRPEQRRVAKKADREKPRASGNPVVRLPEKRAENGVAHPVVRLPEKRSARPGTEQFENKGRSNRAAQWKSAGEETLKKARKLTKSAGKAFRRFGNTLEKRVREGKARLSDRVKSSGQSSKPVRTAAARRESGVRGSNVSMRIPSTPSHRQPPRRVPPRGTRNARPNARSRQGRETFLERHLRSLIAMTLLAITVIVFCVWCTSTTSGKRTFAQLGIGSASGYILLGDDCMESGNYARAVEHYYRALSRHTTYESAIKLAHAYQMTGDTDREASVLLLCADQFETEREPYERLKALYPTLTQRPETVQNALNRGAHVLGDASIAQ